MTQPVSPSLITKFAELIEATATPTLWSKPAFRRIRVQSPDGIEVALPSRSEPTRMRLFDIGPESAIKSALMTSDEDRFVIDYVLLLRVYYPEMSAVAGQGDPALLEHRIKLADYIVLMRSLIEANIFSHVISGSSAVVDGGAIFPPGLIEWRFNVTQEELTV